MPVTDYVFEEGTTKKMWANGVGGASCQGIKGALTGVSCSGEEHLHKLYCVSPALVTTNSWVFY
jgi:hypothetical protein